MSVPVTLAFAYSTDQTVSSDHGGSTTIPERVPGVILSACAFTRVENDAPCPCGTIATAHRGAPGAQREGLSFFLDKGGQKNVAPAWVDEPREGVERAAFQEAYRDHEAVSAVL